MTELTEFTKTHFYVEYKGLYCMGELKKHGLYFQGKLLLEQNKLELASFHVRFVFLIFSIFHVRAIFVAIFL